jgi:two-component system, OmpR family, alkaline phosphatase synthesis response regulator PhoP
MKTLYQCLIVEDDEQLNILYQWQLQRKGFEVATVTDGGKAIEYLKHHSPQILLLDIRLPKVNGLEVLEFIRMSAHLEHVYIVIVTAHAKFQQDAASQRANEYLVKPVRPDDLEAVLLRAKQSLSRSGTA